MQGQNITMHMYRTVQGDCTYNHVLTCKCTCTNKVVCLKKNYYNTHAALYTQMVQYYY